MNYFERTMTDFNNQAAVHGPAVAWAIIARRTIAALRERATTHEADTFVVEAEHLWATDDPEPDVLERLRVQVWQYLETKNGNSTTIAGAEDRTLRCLVGMLLPFRTEDDVADAVEWSAQMCLGAES